MTEKRMSVYDSIEDNRYFEGAYNKAIIALEELEQSINSIRERAKHLNPEDRIYPRCLEMMENCRLINHLIDGHLLEEIKTVCFTIQETTKEMYGSHYIPNWSNTLAEQEEEYIKMLAMYLDEEQQ